MIIYSFQNSYIAKNHLAQLVRIPDQLSDHPFGIVYRHRFFAFRMFAF